MALDSLEGLNDDVLLCIIDAIDELDEVNKDYNDERHRFTKLPKHSLVAFASTCRRFRQLAGKLAFGIVAHKSNSIRSERKLLRLSKHLDALRQSAFLVHHARHLRLNFGEMHAHMFFAVQPTLRQIFRRLSSITILEFYQPAIISVQERLLCWDVNVSFQALTDLRTDQLAIKIARHCPKLEKLTLRSYAYVDEPDIVVGDYRGWLPIHSLQGHIREDNTIKTLKLCDFKLGQTSINDLDTLFPKLEELDLNQNQICLHHDEVINGLMGFKCLRRVHVLQPTFYSLEVDYNIGLHYFEALRHFELFAEGIFQNCPSMNEVEFHIFHGQPSSTLKVQRDGQRCVVGMEWSLRSALSAKLRKEHPDLSCEQWNRAIAPQLMWKQWLRSHSEAEDQYIDWVFGYFTSESILI